MSKRTQGRSGRTPKRSATRGRQHDQPHLDGINPEELELLAGLRDAMRAHPLALVELVSTLMQMSGDSPEGVTLAQLVDGFLMIPYAETSAALHVIAALTTDDVLATRIRRGLASRRHPLPLDLAELGQLRATRARRMEVPFDVGDDLILELASPGVRDICLLVYIDHRRGTVVKDAFLLHDPLAQVIDNLRATASRDGYDPAFPDVDLADARARLEHGIMGYETLDHGWPPGDTWPALLPFVRFLARSMPEGGTAYPDGESVIIDASDVEEGTREEADDLAHDFLAWAGDHDLWTHDDADHELAHIFGNVAVSLLNPDEYRWETTDIEPFLTEGLPVLLSGEPAQYARAPELLGHFVRFCHETEEIDDDVTAAALASIARSTPAFLAKRDDPAILAERKALLEEQIAVRTEDIRRWRTETLIAYVGSADALARLDDDPLPDEDLDVTGLPDDIVERVCRVSSLVDGVAAALYDVETRTACRRLLPRGRHGRPRDVPAPVEGRDPRGRLALDRRAGERGRSPDRRTDGQGADDCARNDGEPVAAGDGDARIDRCRGIGIRPDHARRPRPAHGRVRAEILRMAALFT